MKKEYLITTITLIIVWLILSIQIDNSIILPNPIDVSKSILYLLFDKSFYIAILLTLKRVFIGLFISMFISILLANLSSISVSFKRLFEPISVIAKTIPNISYIIIILIWFGSEISVSIIVFLILFPTFYSHFLLSLNKIKNSTYKLLNVYKISNKEKVFNIYIPMILPDIVNEIKLGFSLGFKVCIMAEILGQVNFGLGKMLYLAKIDLDMVTIFAITIFIVIISVMFEVLFNQLYKKVIK